MTNRPGTVITFYSYKGGTGRSMALANVAWILAASGKRVLVIDWDLEAPGLHRYFRPFLIDPELHDTEGLTDYLWQHAETALTPPEHEKRERLSWEEATDLSRYRVQIDWEFDEGQLDLVPAGRQCREYAERVNSFDWDNFYRRLDGELLLKHLRERLIRDYDYVLIDSRTGVSDSAGICTVALPDRLVAFFTLNRQSVQGVAAVLESVAPQRPDLRIFPVVTRVELAEKERLEASRRWARQVFASYADKEEFGDAQRYWLDAEILYHPYYAYEEVLACFGDPTGTDYSHSSLLASMERLGKRVTTEGEFKMPEVPDSVRRGVLDKIAGAQTAKPQPAEASDDFDTLSRRRRERANRYLFEELGNPLSRYRQMGRKLDLISISVGLAVLTTSFGLVAYLLKYYRRYAENGAIGFGPLDREIPSAALLSILSLASVGVLKAIELGLARSKQFNPAAAQIASALVGFVGFVAPLILIVSGVIWPWLLMNAFWIPALQTFMTMSGLESRRVLLPAAASAIEREVRAYARMAELYDEGSGEGVAWRRFRHAVEEIMAETPPPPSIVFEQRK